MSEVVDAREKILNCNWEIENWEKWRRTKPMTKHSRLLIDDAMLATTSPMVFSTQQGDLDVSKLATDLIARVRELEARLYGDKQPKSAPLPGQSEKEELIQSEKCEACDGIGTTTMKTRTKSFLRTCVACGGTGRIRKAEVKAPTAE